MRAGPQDRAHSCSGGDFPHPEKHKLKLNFIIKKPRQDGAFFIYIYVKDVK